MDTRNLLSLSGVLMILGGTLYYWGMGPAAPQLTDSGDQLPDYEVSGVQSWQTDDRGQLYRQISAASAVHYRGSDDRTVVSQPVMTLYREGAPSWQVSAQKAVGTDRNREVQLSNQVHAERVAAGAVPVQVDMPTLNVHMQAQTMDTKDEVTVHAGKLGHVQSHGFDADLRADTMNLLNEVQGTYVTHP